MLVQVKLIKRNSWSGFDLLPKCKDTIVAREGRSGYNTGLTKEEAEKLEKEMRMEPGTLDRFSRYWRDYGVFLTDKGLTLDLDNPKDFLDYKLLTVNEKVAPSINEQVNCPKSRYVIYDVQDEAKKENEFNKIKKKAFIEFGKLSISDMKKVLKLFGNASTTNTTDEIVENTLMNIVETKPSEFLKVINIEDFTTRLLIEDLLHTNIIRKVGTRYEYGQDVLGHTLDKTIAYFKDPINNELVLTLRENLETKNKLRK